LATGIRLTCCVVVPDPCVRKAEVSGMVWRCYMRVERPASCILSARGGRRCDRRCCSERCRHRARSVERRMVEDVERFTAGAANDFGACETERSVGAAPCQCGRCGGVFLGLFGGRRGCVPLWCLVCCARCAWGVGRAGGGGKQACGIAGPFAGCGLIWRNRTLRVIEGVVEVVVDKPFPEGASSELSDGYVSVDRKALVSRVVPENGPTRRPHDCAFQMRSIGS